ncbi:hypothetical protein [Devosia lacusdianchii]|uniref:hypothetical protein n=1 Tax=Devosia lacusdianchii TaxID=2917991 RepID=UPI001F0567CE|nr:hypothetical protein [Devosia sp. JXJ CY 41]
MTPRQAKLVRASEAVDRCKREIESDWPRSKMDDPMLHPDKRAIFASKQDDVAALDLASKAVMAVAADPDQFGKVMELRRKDRSAFDAIMVLVDIELARKPEAVAA